MNSSIQNRIFINIFFVLMLILFFACEDRALVAIENNDTEILYSLVSSEDYRTFRDNEGNSLLHIAIRRNRVSTVKMLLENGFSELINSSSNNGNTPLIIAAHYGYLTIAEILIQNGAEVNSTDGNWNALAEAVSSNNVSMAHLLLESGANPNAIINEQKESPLMLVFSYGGIQGCTRLLIEHGADINKKDKNGRTMLHSAFYNGYDFSRYFLENGANPNIEDDIGETPFIKLIKYGNNFDLVDLFIKHGAEINKKYKDAYPLDLAIGRGKQYKEFVNLLIKAGAVNSFNMER